jgi:diacylglycerol kinase (ATP)
MPPARVLLLHNPASRAGEAAADTAAQALTAAAITVEPLACAGRDDTLAKLRAAHAGFDAVVACGGDGTMNTVANALAGSTTPLGIIPSGTANDLARTLGLPDDPAAAAAIIAAGHTRAIDLGAVNGAYFLNVASIGLSVALARGLTPGLKRRWGKLSYAIAALNVLVRARPLRATIDGDDEDARVRTYQIAVGNGRFYGGGMAVEESAAIDDGRLDLYSLELSSLWRLVFMLPAFRAGRHGLYREVRAAQGQWFEVRTRRPRHVNADGEIIATTPARFTVHPGALTVFAPA